MFLVELARVFCQNTSIRGVGKIFKAPSVCLRILWLLYVLCMLGLLVYSTTRLFKDYLEYSTIIQTSWGISDDSEFPSLTFCNHYPFSEVGKQHWRNGSVMSPTKWNLKLREKLKNCVNEDNIGCGLNSFLDDTKRMYYQNLKPSHSELIGHRLDNSILLCVVLSGSMLNVGTSKECNINVESISLVNYFNCFTVRPKNPKHTSKLILVLNVTEKPDFDNLEQAFITDIFEQAHGVRMVVHEPGTFPNIEARGDQVEPGKMVEVSYRPIRVTEVKTPRKPCFENLSEYPIITDLNKTYNYTSESCRSMSLNEKILNKCGCYFSDNLRPGVPNEDYPYCGEILKTSKKAFAERRGCVQSLKAKMLEKEDDDQCHRRCEYFRYTTRTSITKWRPTQWQVYWARSQLKALNNLYDTRLNKSKHIRQRTEQKEILRRYATADNLTDMNDKITEGIPTNADEFVYIVLSRQDSPVMLEQNKLTLTLNGVVSRVGGLCSLYLGLTCAFGVELIEFFYLIKQKYSKSNDNVVSEKSDILHEANNNPYEPGMPISVTNNNCLSTEPMIGGRESPMYGMTSHLCDNSKTDDESPWRPRYPLNSTSL